MSNTTPGGQEASGESYYERMRKQAQRLVDEYERRYAKERFQPEPSMEVVMASAFLKFAAPQVPPAARSGPTDEHPEGSSPAGAASVSSESSETLDSVVHGLDLNGNPVPLTTKSSESRATKLAKAVQTYDRAIASCGNDPDKMSSFCTAQGDDLDKLYFDMVKAADAINPPEPKRA